MADDRRGVLYPAGLPTFHRMPAPERVSAFVRWYWIPEWDIAPGRVSRQELIAFPTCNLVVEPELVGLSGPTTRRSFRDLTGSGWAVGALLRPAAVPRFTADPAALRNLYQELDLPALHSAVANTMTRAGDAAARRSGAVRAFTDWLADELPKPAAEALLANAMAELIDSDPKVVRVDDAATRLDVSARTLQRLARRYVGLPPTALIRRRRLQEAAERLRTDPDVDITAVAAEFGYADHAHLTADFRTMLGFTPSVYRRRARP